MEELPLAEATKDFPPTILAMYWAQNDAPSPSTRRRCAPPLQLNLFSALERLETEFTVQAVTEAEVIVLTRQELLTPAKTGEVRRCSGSPTTVISEIIGYEFIGSWFYMLRLRIRRRGRGELITIRWLKMMSYLWLRLFLLISDASLCTWLSFYSSLRI